MPVILVTAVPAFQTAWLWYKPRDYYSSPSYHLGLLRWLSGKESTCNAGDGGSTPGSRRSPEEGNGNPLQHSCLGNVTDRGAYGQPMGLQKSQKQLVSKQQQQFTVFILGEEVKAASKLC